MAAVPRPEQHKFVVCDGNEAAALAVVLARVDMVAVYPITPQSSLAEYLAPPAVTKRTDDDMTLAIATRRALPVATG